MQNAISFFAPQCRRKESAQEILERIDQHAAMQMYLGFTITPKRTYSSPFRRDKNPSCAFYWSNRNRFVLHDYAKDEQYDLFDCICLKYNKTISEAIEIVRTNYGIGIEMKPVQQYAAKHFSTTVTDIRATPRRWKNQEFLFWRKYGISKSELQLYQVFPFDVYFINGKIYRSDNELSFAFRIDHNAYQLYFPMRNKASKKPRFLTGTMVDVMGLRQLQQQDVIILTKSYKDIMALRAMGYDAIAFAGESKKPDETIKKVIDRYQYKIINYDFDYAGIKGANFIRKELSMECAFLTNGRFGSQNFYAKDITDYMLVKNWQSAKDLVDNTVKYLIDKIDKKYMQYPFTKKIR